MNSKILRISLIAALAGFLFGFDTVVISGAEKKLQLLWNSSEAFHGTVVIGMALFGTVIGAILGGIPTNKIGRKNTLIWIGILYSVSAIGSAFANDPVTFGIWCLNSSSPFLYLRNCPGKRPWKIGWTLSVYACFWYHGGLHVQLRPEQHR